MRPMLLFSIIFFSTPAMAKLVEYQIDPAHSSIEFSVKHLGLVPVKGRFTKFEGKLHYHSKKNIAQKCSYQD